MHAQPRPSDIPRLTRSEFGCSGNGLATEVIQRENLLSSKGGKCLFIVYYMNLQMIDIRYVLVQSGFSILLSSISLEINNQCLNFLHGNSYQRKIASKSTTVGWLGSGLPSHAQTLPY